MLNALIKIYIEILNLSIEEAIILFKKMGNKISKLQP